MIGKYLSPRLYVSYGISLVDEINTLKLRYTISDRWVISAESGRSPPPTSNTASRTREAQCRATAR